MRYSGASPAGSNFAPAAIVRIPLNLFAKPRIRVCPSAALAPANRPFSKRFEQIHGPNHQRPKSSCVRGRRLAAMVADESQGEKLSTHLTFLLNFFDELRRKAPAEK